MTTLVTMNSYAAQVTLPLQAVARTTTPKAIR
jgi:hypothetical protein